MSDELEKDPKIQLAIAVATGQSAGKWAKDNNVPRSTAYGWTDDPEFKARVEEIRRRTLNQAIGIMSRHTTRAARGITQLADSAESESVKLQALRSILHDMMKVSNFSNFTSRLNKIEEQLRDSNARKSGAAQAI
jgi:predicted metalloendopeptidase